MNTFPSSSGNARASVVNRVHRVVREQALEMQAQRQHKRGLWIPLGISSVLLTVVCYAVWMIMDADDVTPSGVPDASAQMMIMLMWFLPVTALAMGTVWVRRNRRNTREVSR